MQLDSKLFLHDSDKAAMAALKAIPGFSQVVKAFMKIWNEKQFKIINMSTNLKLSEQQMAKYYNMLPPICEKLGIEVPELYVELDVVPNAYTYGDTKPFIVITSGLFETLPDELIPSVLAHECGHIACHHTLYTTMGRTILSGASQFVSGLGNVALYPIQLAFAYWMRCSEFSADRAAMICDGTASKVIDTMMRFAGYDKDIMAGANVDLFMDQAKEYMELVKNNTWNKTLEFILSQNYDHPLNAVRAYEANEWAKTERFKNIVEYVNNKSKAEELLPIELHIKSYKGKNIIDVQTELMTKGFLNIETERLTEVHGKAKNETVVSVIIDGNEEPNDDFYKKTCSICIRYYEAKTEEEIALEHPGEVKISENAKFYVGKEKSLVEELLYEQGFTNIEFKEMAIPKFGLGAKEGNVAKILIDNQSQFEKNSWYLPDAKITVYVYVSIK